jgi:hypothetical protein
MPTVIVAESPDTADARTLIAELDAYLGGVLIWLLELIATLGLVSKFIAIDEEANDQVMHVD